MKRNLFTAILVFMVIGGSAQNIEIDGIYYNLSPDTKTAEVVSNPKKYSGEVTIPAILNIERKKYQVTKIANKAFSANYSLTSVTLPEGLKEIGASAFSYCRLDSIVVPNSVQTIGDFAFAYCTSIHHAVLGKSVTTMGNGVFVGCESMVSVEVPDLVKTLGTGVFNNCGKLISASIGKGVESLGPQCFANCKSLKYFYSHPDLVPTADNTAFDGTKTGKVKLFVPMFSVKFYKEKEPWDSFKDVVAFSEE